MLRYSFAILALSLALAPGAHAMPEGGCGAGDCRSCHFLTVDEATKLLGDSVDRVLAVRPAEVPGLWAVDVERGEQKIPLYIDFSKEFVLSGTAFRLTTKENVTERRQMELDRVDPKVIAPDEGLFIGDRAAPQRFYVFTDPDCPFCAKLHDELKAVVGRRPDVAFAVKLLPLEMHPDAYRKAKAIVCDRSLSLLEESFRGGTVPTGACETRAVEDTRSLAQRLGIRMTPTLVLPDGRVAAGYRTADAILELLAPPAKGDRG